MCDIEGENEVPEVFKCRDCGEISYKELMCHCNDDNAKEYMDNHPKSELSSTLIKCYKCSNSWYGYKRCDCDCKCESDSDNDDLEEETILEDTEIEDTYTEEYFNDFVKCNNCGNIWDGCAQCNCWGIPFDNDETESKDNIVPGCDDGKYTE